jgi:hypothetical protein
MVGPSGIRDRLIRDYNIVIDELMVANNIAVTPPIPIPILTSICGSFPMAITQMAQAIRQWWSCGFKPSFNSDILNQWSYLG